MIPARGKIPAELVERARRVPIASLAARDGVKLTKLGLEFSGLCPFHADKTASLRIYPDHFHCFACGAHGDAIEWRMRLFGKTFREAVEGLIDAAARGAPQRDGNYAGSYAAPATIDRAAAAAALRAASAPIAGTRGEFYLRRRGYHGPLGPTLLWCEAPNRALPRGLRRPHDLPCIVAEVTAPDGAFARAVHRIYLDREAHATGAAREKMLLGSPGAGAVRLAPVPASGMLGLAEGIETALAVMQACPGLRCWSAISAGRLVAVELPPEIDTPIILADRDRVSWAPGTMCGKRPGEFWANRAARRFRLQGRHPLVRVPWGESCDFADLLLEGV